MDQESWITKLFADARPKGFDPLVETHEDDEYQRWEKYAGHGEIDERNVLPNEVVIDPDYETTEKCIEEVGKMVDFLDQKEIPYILADTGGTGFHIHVFFDVNDLPLEQFRGARIALFELIKEDMKEFGVDIPEEDNTIPDKGLAYFNENETNGHLTRAIGGKKIETGEYKTVVDDVEKAHVTDKDDVTYPDDIDVMTISGGYVNTPYEMDELEEMAEKIRQRERSKRQRKKAEAYETDDDGLRAVRNIPAYEVLSTLGRGVSKGEMISCPQHNDSTPSCLIRDDGTAACWGSCGEPGEPEYINAIDIVVGETDKDFKGAVRWLCNTFDIENPLDSEEEMDENNNDSGDGGDNVSVDGDTAKIENENFYIEVRRPRFSSGKLRGEVAGNYKGDGQDEIYSDTSITSRKISEFAKNLCIAHQLDQDTHKDEIRRLLLKNKSRIRQLANDLEDDDDEEDEMSALHKGNRSGEPNEIEKKVIKDVYENDGTKSIEALEDEYDNIESLTTSKNEYVFKKGDALVLTDRGEHKAEELLGLSEYGSQENVKERAEEILEDEPLKEFLDAMNKLHKGDHKLKIWELVSALSAKCSKIQINSWALGKSLTGDTEVLVEKEDGWHVQTLRSLSKEYDGQDWKTVGVDPVTQELTKTEIENVLEHRHQRELVEIETRSGRTITGTADHSFLKHQDGEVAPVQGEDIEEGDYIPAVRDASDIFEGSEASDSDGCVGYVVGVYLAEGRRHSENRVYIHNQNDNVGEKLKKAMSKTGMKYNEIDDGRISVDITGYRGYFDDANSGSKSKEVPPQAFNKSERFKKMLVRGYFDGDGCIQADGKIGFETTSKKLGHGIDMLLRRFGILTTYRRKKAHDWSEDHKNYVHRYYLTKPESVEAFREEIGLTREFPEYDVSTKQQYIDRVPISYDKVKRVVRKAPVEGRRKEFLNKHVRETEEMSRIRIEDLADIASESMPYTSEVVRKAESEIFWDKVVSVERKDERRRRVYDIVAGDVPHFLLANGSIVHNSGGGKSHLKRTMVKFFPEDSYIKPNSISPKALFYYTNKEGTDFFKNKLIFFDEAEGYDEDETIELLRALTDQDEDIVSHMTVKEQEVDTLIIEKPLTVWFTSTESIADEQLKNRFILTNPDNSEDLDREVHQHQKEHYHRGVEPDKLPTNTPVIREMIRDIRDNTSSLSAVVPFNVEWKQEFNRRLYPYFYTLMEIIAKIHYKQRRVENGKIVVTKADFDLASKIWGSLIETTIAQQDDDSIKIMRELPEKREDAIGTSDIAGRLDGFGTNKVYRKCQKMLNAEDLALINGEKSGGKWVFWAGKDRELLVDPAPEFDGDEEFTERILEDTVGYDEELVDYVYDVELGVTENLEDNDFESHSIDNGMEDDRSSGEDEITVGDVVEEVYPGPNEDPESLSSIIDRAEEAGVDEEDFKDAHKQLAKDGVIHAPKVNRWKRT